MSTPSTVPHRPPASGSGLLGEVTPDPGGGWSAPLRVPHGHPFFFDHPLDHVSGMLLICAAWDLADVVAPPAADGGLLTTRLSFPALCELGRPASVRVAGDAAAAEGLRIDVTQDGTTTCGGVLRRSRATAPVDGGRDHAPPPCPADLLHRARADNVLLGAPTETGTAITWPVLRPRRGHYLAGHAGGGHTARSLVEAARQVTTMIFHHVGERPAGTQMIWLGLTAELPYACPGEAVALRWTRTRIRGSRFAVVLDLLHEPSSARLGGVTIDVTAVSAAAYRRFRDRSAGGRP